MERQPLKGWKVRGNSRVTADDSTAQLHHNKRDGTRQLRDFPDFSPTYTTFLALTSSYEPEKFLAGLPMS